MRIILFLAIALCSYAADGKATESAAVSVQNKRQTHEESVPQLIYRTGRKQEQVAPVEEPQDEDKPAISRSDNDVYRPGQVISLNTQELLELQPERKAPISSNQLLQQLYINPQQEHKQNLQYYYVEPQAGRQVSSHAVIARPHYSLNGGEASVGAALSVSDGSTSSGDTFDQELLTLQAYSQAQQAQQASTVQSIAPQYQQAERYVAKPSKKPTKLRSKVPMSSQPTTAPQQYLIETTNVQQQQQQQYRPAPQPQRVAQALRYIPFQLEPNEQGQLTEQAQQAQQLQQAMYERPEPQGLKIIPAPNLQQARAQLNYRFVPQYQQTEAPPKQYRLPETQRPQPVRQDLRYQAPIAEKPVAYLKRYPEPDKMRSVKIYDPVASEGLSSQAQQPSQLTDEQYTNYLRSVYRTINEHRLKAEQSRMSETTKPPHSAIYVSKNVFPRKPVRPLPLRDQNVNVEQLNIQQVNAEQSEQDMEEERARLPPPKNNKAYTPEEFAALVAAGYSVTPVPVGSLNLLTAQSRSSVETVLTQPKRRPAPSRRHQYLPLRGDDAP